MFSLSHSKYSVFILFLAVLACLDVSLIEAYAQTRAPLTEINNNNRRSSRRSRNRNTSNQNQVQTETKKDTGLFSVNDKGLVNLDFVNADIAEIARSISELMDRNFVFDEKLRGKITLVSPRPVKPEEAYRAFISALEVKNFTVVKVGKLYKIVAVRDMKTQPLPTSTRKPYGSSDEFVTRLIPVEHSNAQELSKSLRGLISKNGDLIAYAPTNMLILTDKIANIRRVMKIISNLDKEGFQESVEFIPLEYAAAQDVTEKIKQLFDIGSSKSTSSTSRNNNRNRNTANQAQAASSASSEKSHFISKILPDDRTNSVIVVANKAGIRRVKDLVKQLDQAMIDQAGRGRVHVHYLQYADATELSGILSGISSNTNNSSSSRNRNNNRNRNTRNNRNNNQSNDGILGEDVKITADPYTNALIVTAAPNDYESLIPVINKLDIRRPQAFVEAMILEVDIDKASEFGLTGHGGFDLGSDVKLFGGTSLGGNSSIFPPASADALNGFTTLLQGPTFALPLAGGETLTIPAFGGLFRMLQSNGTINVISTPNILTQDNTEAEIVIGRVVPFVTSQGRDVNNQPINQVQREDVATTLRLTPQINSSDELTLNIFQESQDLVAGANSDVFGPTTSKRSTQTTVLVKDGQTVTIGGLISDKITNTVSKVPVLGDIPLLGWLFKNKSKTRTKTSLVIFITPHIIRYPEDLERITIEKNEMRKQFLKRNRMQDHPALDNKTLERNIRLDKKARRKNRKKNRR